MSRRDRHYFEGSYQFFCFYVRFNRQVRLGRFTFEEGETLRLHERHWPAFHDGSDTLDYGGEELPIRAMEIVADCRGGR